MQMLSKGQAKRESSFSKKAVHITGMKSYLFQLGMSSMIVITVGYFCKSALHDIIKNIRNECRKSFMI